MSAAEFTSFLVDEIEASNAAFVNELLANARAAITAGKGTIAPLLTGSVNGKSFTRELQMGPAEVAICCRNAIKEAAGTHVISTAFDFSGTNGI